MDDLAAYPYLFDRRRTDHPWLGSLADQEASPYPENRALARNWRMDHRVTEPRESDLLALKHFPTPADPARDFAKAVRDYFGDRLCVPPDRPPDYAASANLGNRIPPDTVAPNHPLVHLASLSALLGRTLGSFDLREVLLDRTGVLAPDSGALPPGDLDRIGEGLAAAGEEAIRELAGVVSDALGPREPHWWAAFAYEVDPHLEGIDWTAAARTLGLGHLGQGDWLIAWRYAPEVAGPLYRPTVAEAGAYGYHFPSPPGDAFGVTMPLDPGLAAVKEVIHAPLKGDLSAESCLGRLGRIVQPLGSDP